MSLSVQIEFICRLFPYTYTHIHVQTCYMSTKPNGIGNSKYYLILNLRWIIKYHLNRSFYVDNLYQTNGVS